MAARSSIYDHARGDVSSFPYRLYGGAAERGNSITGLNAGFYDALMKLYRAAPPEVQRELGLTSGYRDYETQLKLWNASDKTGHSVARPGTSKHESGTAADLYGFGLKNQPAVSQATRDWVRANAAAHNLYFPMDYEPWHIQMKAVDEQLKAAGYTPEQRRNAIASIESAGSGDYNAVGPEADPAGHRARGRYQVMDYNIAPWAKQYLGMDDLTAEAFMADPALQDKLFDAVFGDYVDKYGEEGAAQAWFGGEGSVGKGGAGKDVLGTTGNDYVSRYMKALQGSGGHVSHPPNPTVGTGGYVKPGADTTPVPTGKGGVTGKDKSKVWEALADAVGGMGGGANWDTSTGLPEQPGAARVDAPVAPALDTAQSDVRRQQLAQILMRLNQGSLVG